METPEASTQLSTVTQQPEPSAGSAEKPPHPPLEEVEVVEEDVQVEIPPPMEEIKTHTTLQSQTSNPDACPTPPVQMEGGAPSDLAQEIENIVKQRMVSMVRWS